MRICIVVHGFPPYERTGVENYAASLAKTLARQGHDVEVFAPRRAPLLPEFSIRRELVDGYGVNWLTINSGPRNPREALDSPQAAERFGTFLDRERPQVVHFQHFIKLGISLVREAAERRIPTLYTAHDYYAVCHRYTLMRPDLSTCSIRGDSMACAECDVALAWLNQIRALGDYQMGALESQLEPAQHQTLKAILSGTCEEPGFDADRLDGSFDLRRELDAWRAEAFDRLDRVIAPTKFLRDELVRGGIDEKKVEVLPYGIENDDLLGVTPVRPDPARPVRFGFFGGLAKHKGIHVLLGAFEKLKAPAELSLWGGSTDAVYVEAMRERALAAGAMWRGPYERPDLPGLLAEVDVVIVPSIWVENYPIVIREAMSARRPVITSDHGALPESVKHEVDGLRFTVGDADALAEAMERCSAESGLVEKLAAGIEKVHDIETQGRELAARYQALIADAAEVKAKGGAALPPSLGKLAERHRKLSAMPNRELFSRAIVRLEKLRKGLGTPVSKLSVEELLLRTLASFSRAQVMLRDASLENAWMHDTLEGREGDLRSMSQERDWLSKQNRSLNEERDWLRDVLSATDKRLEARENDFKVLDEERAWLKDIVAGREEEVQWLRTLVQDRDEELGWMRDRLSAVLGSHGELESLSNELRKSLEESDKGNRQLKQDLERTEQNLETTRANLQRVGALLGASEENLKRTERNLRGAESQLDVKRETLEATEADLQSAESDLRKREADLETTGENLKTTADNLAATERSLESTERDLLTTRNNLEVTEQNLGQTEEHLQSAAELGLVSLRAQERLIGAEIVPLLEEIGQLDETEDLTSALSRLPQDRPEFVELLKAAKVSRERMQKLSAELEWRREEMGAAYRAYQRRLANFVLRRTGFGHTLDRWTPEAPGFEEVEGVAGGEGAAPDSPEQPQGSQGGEA